MLHPRQSVLRSAHAESGSALLPSDIRESPTVLLSIQHGAGDLPLLTGADSGAFPIHRILPAITPDKSVPVPAPAPHSPLPLRDLLPALSY